MPRVPYRPFTMYEEAVGLTGSQRVSRILLAINGFCLFTSIGIWTLCSMSRHQDDVPVEFERKGNDHLRERNDMFIAAIYGTEQRNRAVRDKYSPYSR